MPKIPKEKQVFVVEKFFKRNSYSYIAVQAAFLQQFNEMHPCKKTIQQNFTKCCSHGMTLKRNKENSGRQTACSE